MAERAFMKLELIHAMTDSLGASTYGITIYRHTHTHLHRNQLDLEQVYNYEDYRKRIINIFSKILLLKEGKGKVDQG